MMIADGSGINYVNIALFISNQRQNMKEVFYSLIEKEKTLFGKPFKLRMMKEKLLN